MKITLPGLAACALLGASASADVHSRTYFVSNGPQAAFVVMHVDFDDATNFVSVWSDYQGFLGDVTSVSFEGPPGVFALELQHEGGRAGFAWGTSDVGEAGEAAILAGDANLVFTSTFAPAGELVANAFFGMLFSLEVTLDPGQVPTAPVSQGTGSAFLLAQPDGSASMTGFAGSLSSAVTAVEVRGPATPGNDGPLIAVGELTSFTESSASFTVEWTTADAQALDEFEDGLVYVLVRTVDFPLGEIRGQLAASTIGRFYCPGRPNSFGFNGANMSLGGSLVASDNDVTLSAIRIPPQKAVLPLVGFATGHVFNLPGSSGLLCLGGGPIGRLSGNLGLSALDGSFTTPIDLTALPFGVATAGQELNFQLWHRDVDESGPTTNFSNAVSLRLY